MSHSRTSRRGTTRRRRYASEIGSPPVRSEPRSVRRRSMCSPRRSRSARRVRAQRRREPDPGHQPGRAAPARPARARRSASRPAAPRRWPRRGSGPRRRRCPASRRGRAPPRCQARRLPSPGRGSSPAEPWPATSPGVEARVSSPAASPRAVSRRSSGASTREPNTAKNTRSNAATCAGSETSTARAVQYSRVRETGRVSVNALASRAERSAVTGTPAACRRRPKAATSGARSSSTVSSLTPASPAPRRGRRPGPRRTSRPSRACGRSSPASSVATPSSSSAFSQSIASAMPGGFWMSPSRIFATAVTTCTRQRLRRAAHAPAHDLDLALRRPGSRSTGTGSGA